MKTFSSAKPEEVLRRARELQSILKLEASARPVVQNIIGLLEKDISRLSEAIRSGDARQVSTGLMFPSLDGRAADSLGGFDWEASATRAAGYRALNEAIADAVDDFEDLE